MKVCIYSPSERIWGGGQIYIDGLCQYLNDHGVEASIVSSEPETFSSPSIGMASVSRKIDRLMTAPTLAKELKSKGVKLIVLNDLSSLWLAPVFRLFGFKVVSLLHLILQKKNDYGFGHTWVQYHLLRFFSRFSHQVLSVNKNNDASFPVNVHFVGNFVPSWFFDNDRGSAKYDLGLVSRLSPEKNVPLFVELVWRLNNVAKRPVTALIVGDGVEEPKVRRLISNKGLDNLVEIRPWVSRVNLPSVYDEIGYFAVTSFHEGFATTALEAHARGTPVITTSTAGFCPEFVLGGDVETGTVFEISDLQDDSFLSDLVCKIDSSVDLFHACRKKALNFSDERVLGRIKDFICVLL